MHARTCITAIIAFLFAFGMMFTAPAQSAATASPSTRTMDLAPGEKVTDSAGRTVENKGTSGVVKVTYSGSKSGTGQNIEVGDITLIRNPGTNGSKNVEIHGVGTARTTVQLDEDGTSGRGNGVTVKVTGGNTDVTVSGDYNEYSVGGTGNTVTVAGDNNTGTGENASSGGTVHYQSGATGNTFASNGGNWTYV